MTWTVEQAELLEWLKNYSGPRFSACQSDPPYALISISERFGKEGSAPVKEAGTDGSFGRLSGGFMNALWDGGTDFHDLPSYQAWVTRWGRLLIEKALHPGALGMFFGSPRTFHRLACGLEDAGWILKDCLSMNYGSGFPKSLDLSKAIDRAAGARRDVVGTRRADDIRGGNLMHRAVDGDDGVHEIDITTPATDAAKAWDGWKTSLKPAWEPILMAMTPRQGLTHVELALRFGTGALNIDAARIGVSGGTARSEQAPYPKNDDGTEDRSGSWARTGHGIVRIGGGRYPANVILAHDERCVRRGTRKIPSTPAHPLISGGQTYDGWSSIVHKTGQVGNYGDSDGTETVEDWACVADCPVAMINAQSGDLSPGGDLKGDEPSSRTKLVYEGGMNRGAWEGYGDRGGAARFFYCAKPDSFEREAGLEGLPEMLIGKSSAAVADVKRGEGPQNRTGNVGLNDIHRVRNIHPTLKSLKITKYLATLLLPPPVAAPRRLLVPFCGSGSEMIGGLLAGWDEVVGIEREENYCAIARARIPWWLSHPDGLETTPETRARKEAGRSSKLTDF